MTTGSYKDVVGWFKLPWLRATVIVGVLSYVLWEALLWALEPGFWTGSWIGSHSDSPLIQAKEHFGPVLLVKWWIRDASGTWGDTSALLSQWGYYESAARLMLIVGFLWVVICATILIPRVRRALQGCQMRSKAGNVPESKP